MIDFIFGGGHATGQHWTLLAAFLMMAGVSYDAAKPATGPGGGPFILLILLVAAIAIFGLLTPWNASRWVGTMGGGGFLKFVTGVGSFIAVCGLWTFAIWATDPNYPERLPRGRILLPAHSILLYVANLYFLWRLRPA